MGTKFHLEVAHDTNLVYLLMATTIVPMNNQEFSSLYGLNPEFIYIHGDLKELCGNYDLISSIENLPEQYVQEIPKTVPGDYDPELGDLVEIVGSKKVVFFPEPTKLDVEVLGVYEKCVLYAKTIHRAYYIANGEKVHIPETHGYVVLADNAYDKKWAKSHVFGE